jgi:cell wall-associated NlpC family hydrolase
LKPGKQKGNRFLIFFLSFLLVVFVISTIISFRQDKSSSATPNEICEFAQQFLSDSYLKKIGKEFDCSEFTRFVYEKYGYKLPRSSAQQFRQFSVNVNELKSGDLVFFSSDKKRVGHVGIYLKNNTFIHSPGKDQEVKMDKLTDKYWKKRFQGSGSVIDSKN